MEVKSLRIPRCYILIFLLNSLSLESQDIAFNEYNKSTLTSLINDHPKCTNPYDIKIFRFDQERIEFKWSGPEPNIDGVRYLVRYRYSKEGSIRTWITSWVTDGTYYIIKNPEIGVEVEIEVKKICDGKGAEYSLSSDWVPVIKSTLNNNEKRAEIQNAEECSWIKAVTAARNSNGTYTITITSDAPDSIGYWRYMVQYRECVADAPLNYAFLLNGDTTTNLTVPSHGICELSVRIIWGGTGGENYEYWCQWINVSLDNDSYPPPVTIACGSGSPANPTNMVKLMNAETLQVWTVSGIPMTITEVTGSNGYFTGKANLGIPFGKKAIQVTFSGIEVNTNFQVISGNVVGVSANLSCYKTAPTYGGPGQDICEPKPNKEGWNSDGTWGVTGLTVDPYGFKMDGTFNKPPYSGYKEGDPYDEDYDPNGFDQYGNHKDTGSKYGPNGCSRDGVDSLGNRCDPSGGNGPYYWINGGGFSESGKKFVEDLGDSLKILIQQNLDELIASKELEGGALLVECTNIRNNINVKIGNLGYDPLVIKGENDIFFKPGMSKNFASVPEKVVTDITRKANQKELEDLHVDLYNCDVRWVKIDTLIDFLNDLKENTNLTQLTAYIKNKIKFLTEDKIKEFKDNQDKFLEWLKEEIKNEVNNEMPDSYTYQPQQLNNGFNKIERFIPRSYSPINEISEFATSHTASTDKYYSIPENLEKEVNFQLRQGWTNILGRHKAIWYEEDALLKQMAGDTNCTHENNTLPIIITKRVLDKDERVYIDNVVIGPNTGSCDVYFILYVPTTGQKFVFAALGVQFGNAGIIGDVKLTIVNDFEIRVNNSTLMRIFGGANDTYVSFDCNGLKEISVSAELEFCRNYLIPVNPTTKEINTDPAAKVKAAFKIKTQGWGQMLIDSLNISSFCVKGAEDIKWSLSLATFDFSDQASPGFNFPPNYGGEFITSDGKPKAAWRGIFIKNIEATLPKKFSKGADPISVGAYNLIFDGMGFTGDVYAKNILSISEGNIGGWAISIDSMTISIVKNELKGGSMLGQMNVPIFTQNLNYFASIYSNNKYEFVITLTDTLTADLWAATVILLPNSGIHVENKDNDFIVSAKLNGLITVDGKMQQLALKVPNVKFEDVIISNKDPYFSPGTWSSTGSAGFKFGNFELTADNIGLYKAEDGKVDLKLTVNLQISDIGSGSVGGKTRLYVRGKIESNNGLQKWVFDKIGLEGVEINAEFSGNKVYGSLFFYSNDPTYGSGFKGGVTADFKGLAEVKVFATFGDMPVSGNNAAYRYFFVDAMVYLDNPIPLGTLSLYGLGGGMYHNMIRTPVQALQNFDYKGEERAPGAAPSGITYTPTSSVGYGFRATVALSTQVKEAFNCNITFEMAFYSGGGLQSISMDGNARMMEPMDYLQLPSKSPGNKPNAALVTANMHVSYDFGSSIFDGSLEVFMNVGGVMRGVGANDKMVDAKIYISKGEWYIHVGTPTSPCGVKYTVPGLGDIAQTKTYLCIGTKIPEMVPLSSRGFPDLQVKNLSIPNRAAGTGFAFGSEIDLGINEKEFLIFYAKLKILMGFDVMIGKFNNVQCTNGGSSSPIGINGWYAQGQAFASIDAAVGIKVKVFGKKKKYEIFDIKAGVGLVAKLPNPFYASGSVYGEYRILHGLVKGKCNFNFEIGAQCEFAEGGEQDLNNAIITDIHPSNSSEALPVHTSCSADFFFPIDKDHFEADPDDPTKSQKFNARISSTRIIDSKGIELPHRRISLEEGHTIQCKPFNLLPPNDSITFEVRCSLYVDNVFDAMEVKQVKFKTGEAQDKIELDNIVGSYPFQNMKYFYQKEFYNGRGYISLEVGQPDLFNGAKDGDIMVKFSSSGSKQQVPAKYNFGTSEIEYNIPILLNNADYLLELVDQRKNLPEGKLLCSYSFHTSSYNTFKEKLIQWVTNSSVVSNDKLDYKMASTIEPFSEEEISSGWVRCYPNLADNQWYTNYDVFENIYNENFGCFSEAAFRRDRIKEPTDNVIKLAPSIIEWTLYSYVNKDANSLWAYYSAEIANTSHLGKKIECKEGGIAMDNATSVPFSGIVGFIASYRLPYKNLNTGQYKVNIVNKTVN